MRATKIICTIGPRTCQYEALEKLASLGMNIARLNMSHGDHEWHKKVIRAIHTINEKGKYSIAILLDTKGSEVRSGDIQKEIHLTKGDLFTFTIRREAEYPDNCTEVSYDGFIDDVKVGDTILVDGGMMTFQVKSKTTSDVVCECVFGGILSSRRHLNIQGKSMSGPSITKRDWKDIDFGIEQKVDFIALSFVKEAQAVEKLKEYLEKKKAGIDVVAKIESVDAVRGVSDIAAVSDGVMIARGDLGAEIPLEDVPLVQSEIVVLCRKLGKPVIIATHLLESMIVHPTPTRAEVTDIAQAVLSGADCIMLSGETASGKYPFETVSVMDRVATRIEKKLAQEKESQGEITHDPKREIAQSAAILANNLGVAAILAFTRRGYMATLLSRYRPNHPIFAFTNMSTVRRRLNLYWGIVPFRIEFSLEPAKTIQRAITLLRGKKLLAIGDTVIVVSDILVGREFVETIQLRTIKE